MVCKASFPRQATGLDTGKSLKVCVCDGSMNGEAEDVWLVKVLHSPQILHSDRLWPSFSATRKALL